MLRGRAAAKRGIEAHIQRFESDVQAARSLLQGHRKGYSGITDLHVAVATLRNSNMRTDEIRESVTKLDAAAATARRQIEHSSPGSGQVLDALAKRGATPDLRWNAEYARRALADVQRARLLEASPSSSSIASELAGLLDRGSDFETALATITSVRALPAALQPAGTEQVLRSKVLERAYQIADTSTWANWQEDSQTLALIDALPEAARPGFPQQKQSYLEIAEGSYHHFGQQIAQLRSDIGRWLAKQRYLEDPKATPAGVLARIEALLDKPAILNSDFGWVTVIPELDPRRRPAQLPEHLQRRMLDAVDAILAKPVGKVTNEDIRRIRVLDALPASLHPKWPKFPHPLEKITLHPTERTGRSQVAANLSLLREWMSAQRAERDPEATPRALGERIADIAKAADVTSSHVDIVRGYAQLTPDRAPAFDDELRGRMIDVVRSIALRETELTAADAHRVQVLAASPAALPDLPAALDRLTTIVLANPIDGTIARDSMHEIRTELRAWLGQQRMLELEHPDQVRQRLHQLLTQSAFDELDHAEFGAVRRMPEHLITSVAEEAGARGESATTPTMLAELVAALFHNSGVDGRMQRAIAMADLPDELLAGLSSARPDAERALVSVVFRDGADRTLEDFETLAAIEALAPRLGIDWPDAALGTHGLVANGERPNGMNAQKTITALISTAIDTPSGKQLIRDHVSTGTSLPMPVRQRVLERSDLMSELGITGWEFVPGAIARLDDPQGKSPEEMVRNLRDAQAVFRRAFANDPALEADAKLIDAVLARNITRAQSWRYRDFAEIADARARAELLLLLQENAS